MNKRTALSRFGRIFLIITNEPRIGLAKRQGVDILVERNDILNDPASETRALARRRLFDRWVLRWLRSCARCGSIRPPIDLFCTECERLIGTQINRGPALLQSGFAFPVYSLFTWTHVNDSVIKPLLYGFKKGLAVRAAEGLSLQFLHEISRDRPRLGPWLVHPGGSGGRDHSWLLAQSFARLIAPNNPIPLVTLKLAGGGSQKLKSATERRARRFVHEEKFSNRANLPWVFVDDVITTGSTAQAAWRALGEPNSFEVWTLACRPKLAGKPSFW